MDALGQQWSAVAAVRELGIQLRDVWLQYVVLGGSSSSSTVTRYLQGDVVLPRVERDILAHAINEVIDDEASLAPRANYSLDCDAEAQTDAWLGLLTPSAVALDFQRCQALFESGLLETGSEDRFDSITARTKKLLGISTSLISLITEDHQVIKSAAGPISEDRPRWKSFCAHTIRSNTTLVVEDTFLHPEFLDHPLVIDAPHIRFYAGHPIHSVDGWRIGTLCVLDTQPRTFSAANERTLRLQAGLTGIEISAEAETW